MSLLYWLESIRNPVLDSVMSVITEIGGEAVFMIVALAIYWCISKKEGYYLLIVGFVGTILSQFLKLFFQIPRPWVKDPKFTTVGSAREGATGYSFPSGHTQNVVGTFGGVARWQKQVWLRIVCIVLIALTAFSRMYLGVHTPMDVGFSFLITAALVFLLYPIVKKVAGNPKGMYLLLGVMSVFSLAFILYAGLNDFHPISTDAKGIEEELACISEGLKNGYSMLGALLGFAVGYTIDLKYIRFEEKAVWWVQIVKVVVGMGLLLGIKEGLKTVFNAVGFTWLGSNIFRYFAIVLFASAIWPMIFSRFTKGRKTH